MSCRFEIQPIERYNEMRQFYFKQIGDITSDWFFFSMDMISIHAMVIIAWIEAPKPHHRINHPLYSPVVLLYDVFLGIWSGPDHDVGVIFLIDGFDPCRMSTTLMKT